MNIEIRYFGMLIDIVGKQRENLSIAETTEIWEFIEMMEKLYPQLKNANYQIAINHSITMDKRTAILKDDELALMPPFAGG